MLFSLTEFREKTGYDGITLVKSPLFPSLGNIFTSSARTLGDQCKNNVLTLVTSVRTGFTPNVIARALFCIVSNMFGFTNNQFFLTNDQNKLRINGILCSQGTVQMDSSQTAQTNSSGESSHVNRTSIWGSFLLSIHFSWILLKHILKPLLLNLFDFRKTQKNYWMKGPLHISKRTKIITERVLCPTMIFTVTQHFVSCFVYVWMK